MTDYVYLLEEELPYECPMFLGAFSTLQRAIDWGNTFCSDIVLEWEQDEIGGAFTINEGHLTVTKLPIDPSKDNPWVG